MNMADYSRAAREADMMTEFNGNPFDYAMTAPIGYMAKLVNQFRYGGMNGADTPYQLPANPGDGYYQMPAMQSPLDYNGEGATLANVSRVQEDAAQRDAALNGMFPRYFQRDGRTVDEERAAIAALYDQWQRAAAVDSPDANAYRDEYAARMGGLRQSWNDVLPPMTY